MSYIKSKKISMALITGSVFLLIGLMAVVNVHAQDLNLSIENMPQVVGAGLGYAPDYEGSDDYMFGGAPFGKYQFPGREQYILLKAFELQANLINHPWLRFGPSLNYRFGRDDVDDDVVDRMDDIDDTIEGGAFIGVEFIDRANPRKRMSADVDFLHDLGGEHDGYTIAFSARFWYPVSKMFDVGLGAGFVYADDDYMSTYFSVDHSDSLRSGLPEFDADSGVKDVRINPVVVMHLSENWHLAGGFQYRRLLNDAEDSPVVDDRGSENQWISGIGVAYSW